MNPYRDSDVVLDHDEIRVLRSDSLQGGVVAASTGGHARQ